MLNGIKKITKFGNIVWIHPKTGEEHRLDGPVIIWGDYREYFINGKWHNINGPAKIWGDGRKEYWIENKPISCKINKHKWLLISLKRKLIQKKKY